MYMYNVHVLIRFRITCWQCLKVWSHRNEVDSPLGSLNCPVHPPLLLKCLCGKKSIFVQETKQSIPRFNHAISILPAVLVSWQHWLKVSIWWSTRRKTSSASVALQHVDHFCLRTYIHACDDTGCITTCQQLSNRPKQDRSESVPVKVTSRLLTHHSLI